MYETYCSKMFVQKLSSTLQFCISGKLKYSALSNTITMDSIGYPNVYVVTMVTRSIFSSLISIAT